MRIDLIEKIVLIVTVFTVLVVGAGVAAVWALPGGLRSGIPEVATQSAEKAMNFVDDYRRRRGVGGTNLRRDHYEAPIPQPAGGAPQGGQAGPAGTPGATPKGAQPPPQEVVSTFFGNDLPPEQQVPGIPWVRKMPGVRYKPPEKVPEILYRKYQSFQDTWDLVQEGGGEFTETDAGTAYQVNWVDQNSYLYSKLGLRPGDKVIAVNGQPIGKSMQAGKAMFEQFKGEQRFAVLIERQGQKTVLSFSVGG